VVSNCRPLRSLSRYHSAQLQNLTADSTTTSANRRKCIIGISKCIERPCGAIPDSAEQVTYFPGKSA
jgi:hypothetical protein